MFQIQVPTVKNIHHLAKTSPFYNGTTHLIYYHLKYSVVIGQTIPL